MLSSIQAAPRLRLADCRVAEGAIVDTPFLSLPPPPLCFALLPASCALQDVLGKDVEGPKLRYTPGFCQGPRALAGAPGSVQISVHGNGCQRLSRRHLRRRRFVVSPSAPPPRGKIQRRLLRENFFGGLM